MMSLSEKKTRLETILRNCGNVLVAFSGGVDSSFLLAISHSVLKDRAAAVTLKSVLFPEREMEDAASFCRKRGIRHFEIEVRPLEEIEGFAANPVNRCYLCKYRLFSQIRELADKENIPFVFDGSNVDDLSDYRPGRKALNELTIRSPLQEAGLTKEDIRTLSKEMGLEGWDKPSRACLASRFVYGETITEERLRMVSRAEEFLMDLGFKQVRVRIHGGTLARIEVMPDEIEKILDMRTVIDRQLKECGFVYSSVDLNGFRSGSMNEGKHINYEY